jgi:23S rRNA (uracil1939-C5)-methyltransferase
VSETFDLTIDSIAAGGDGVGRRDGMVVFVPRTAPDDHARVRADRQDRLMRGRVLELLSPSPRRVEPPCKHYVDDRCGGCQLQHLLYEGQLDAKAGIIRDALTRIGRVTAERPDMEPSDIQWRYRRKLTLALRLKHGRWMAGLHRFDTSDVFELEDCLITDQKVLDGWSQLLAQQQLLPSAKELRGAVRLLESGFSFVLEGAHDWPSRADFFAAVPSMMELWWKPIDKGRRLLDARTGHDAAGASFVQVNPPMATKLLEWVASLAMAQRPRTAVDAYSGVGDIAVALAKRGTRVTAIEIDRDAARAVAARLPDGSIAVTAPVEKALLRALPADVVILNPPRAGVDQKVTEVLSAENPKPRAVIYVSCNPATLARDVRRLDGYRIRSVRGFDMFPQTAHVETVCELVPNTSDVSSVIMSDR